MSEPIKNLKRTKNENRFHPAIADSKSCTRNIMSFVLCVFLLVSLLGCYNNGEVVKIKAMVNSKVDMRKYKNVAVMDFIDNRENAFTTEGAILARMIRKQLGKSKDIQILSEKTTYQRWEGEVDKDKIEDPDILMSICSQLEVDALIVGTFDFQQLNQPVPYIVERYSSRTGQYRPETGTYVKGVYRLSLHAKLVDGATGETVFDYNPPVAEKPKLGSAWGVPFPDDDNTDPASLRVIASKPVNDFILSLVPHYEYEKRILVR